jgi:Rv0078B-related antitoxin
MVVEVIDDATAAMYRTMTPAQRIAAACDAHDTAFAMTIAQVRRAHPDWTDAQLKVEAARRLMRESA